MCCSHCFWFLVENMGWAWSNSTLSVCLFHIRGVWNDDEELQTLSVSYNFVKTEQALHSICRSQNSFFKTLVISVFFRLLLLLSVFSFVEPGDRMTKYFPQFFFNQKTEKERKKVRIFLYINWKGLQLLQKIIHLLLFLQCIGFIDTILFSLLAKMMPRYLHLLISSSPSHEPRSSQACALAFWSQQSFAQF